MIECLLLSSVLLVPLPPDTIHVGDPELGPLALAAGADTIDNYVVQDGNRRLAITYIQTITESPSGYLVVEENIQRSGRTISLDSIFLARGTLAPVWHADVTPSGRRHVLFRSGRMTGLVIDSAGRESRVDEPAPSNLFDYSTFTLIADQLPHSAGYSAVIATQDISRGPVYMPIRVLGQDIVDLHGKAPKAWRVEVDVGKSVVTRWVDTRSRRGLRWHLRRGSQEMIGECRH